MEGINRALKAYSHLRESRRTAGIKCIFLSHQKEDKDVCRKIADYLLESGIDVYFDEYDYDLKFNNQINNPHGVVECIRKGINSSSHMLVVVSPSTLKSKWVPWEVGYGYNNSMLGVLTLKGIQNSDLEAYLQTAPLIVRGIKSLNEYISKITGSSIYTMESYGRIKSFNALIHPLDNYLNWGI